MSDVISDCTAPLVPRSPSRSGTFFRANKERLFFFLIFFKGLNKFLSNSSLLLIAISHSHIVCRLVRTKYLSTI